MTQDEYRKALATLGYSRRDWGHLTDTSFRTVQARAAEGHTIPGAEGALLELLLARPELRMWLEARRPIRHAPRGRPRGTLPRADDS
jgi:hypothetical protein